MLTKAIYVKYLTLWHLISFAKQKVNEFETSVTRWRLYCVKIVMNAGQNHQWEMIELPSSKFRYRRIDKYCSHEPLFYKKPFKFCLLCEMIFIFLDDFISTTRSKWTRTYWRLTRTPWSETNLSGLFVCSLLGTPFTRLSSAL